MAVKKPMDMSAALGHLEKTVGIIGPVLVDMPEGGEKDEAARQLKRVRKAIKRTGKKMKKTQKRG